MVLGNMLTAFMDFQHWVLDDLCLEYLYANTIISFSQFWQASVGVKKQNVAKKQNVPISSIFGNDSDED